MGMLDGLLGGVVGAGMVSVVSGIIEKHGGLQGVVSEFEKNGLGATVQSWVGTGPNQQISPIRCTRSLVLSCCSSSQRNPVCPCRIWHRSCPSCCPRRWISSPLTARSQRPSSRGLPAGGKPFGKSDGTVSADGKALTVESAFQGGGRVDKITETWVRK